ncbi:MAG: glycosyltransferase family 4 protein [Epsilonproteobacteria bacterium]|nr:glycosyltransferase family 4 protein [Campylobacterota bacterium]
MKIIVLGTRGIPDIQGGVETHCQELYPRLIKLGCDVTLITRKSYVQDLNIKEYQGVKLRHIFTPKKKSLEAIIHTLLGVLYARSHSPDILHIHAIGPSLLVPFAKFLGLKVVVTNHGPDYDRQKWGKLAKKVLMFGEKFGSKYANKVIVISNVIKNIQEDRYNRMDCELIYNGVNLPNKSSQTDYISSLALETGKYCIAVGRFVKEKGFHDLIEAYKKIDTDIKLVLVGDADHEDKYSKSLKQIGKDNGVVLTGFIKGEKLNQIFSHAKLFVMPSYHEGLPIALLEAMSYNLDVLVSDIPANVEVQLEQSDYFKVGDVDNLAMKLKNKLDNTADRDFQKIIKERYNWDLIAKQTKSVYEKVLG